MTWTIGQLNHFVDSILRINGFFFGKDEILVQFSAKVRLTIAYLKRCNYHPSSLSLGAFERRAIPRGAIFGSSGGGTLTFGRGLSRKKNYRLAIWQVNLLNQPLRDSDGTIISLRFGVGASFKLKSSIGVDQIRRNLIKLITSIMMQCISARSIIRGGGAGIVECNAGLPG